MYEESWYLMVSVYIFLHICPGLWHDKFHVEHSHSGQSGENIQLLRSNQMQSGHQTSYENPGPQWGFPKNSGFSTQIIHFNRVFHYKPSILWYPYFWNHPNCFLRLGVLGFPKCLRNSCVRWWNGLDLSLDTLWVLLTLTAFILLESSINYLQQVEVKMSIYR